MENTEEFEIWLDRMLEDSKKLNMTDASIAIILIRVGMTYFLKAVAKCKS